MRQWEVLQPQTDPTRDKTVLCLSCSLSTSIYPFLHRIGKNTSSTSKISTFGNTITIHAPVILQSTPNAPMVRFVLKSDESRDQQQQKQKGSWLAGSFKPENFVPGLVIGFIFGWLLDLAKPNRTQLPKKSFLSKKHQKELSVSSNGDQELKMVLVVRQDLKMKPGKIASQCAHASTGLYAELLQSNRSLLRQWEQCGQPKIVVTCRNQLEMNKLCEAADSIGLPTYVVADAGRTQVVAGSKTVLAVGPGPKPTVDSVTGKLPLL